MKLPRRVVVVALLVASLGVGLLPGDAEANTRRNDLKHKHTTFGVTTDYDNHTPVYTYSGGWPYVAAASKGQKVGSWRTHTHAFVACQPSCSN